LTDCFSGRYDSGVRIARPARPPRTQKERRDETRRSLLDATVACIVELGYARTTTLEVQRRAGVSRGALLHHFPSKAELLVASVRHLAQLRGRELHARAAKLPDGGDRVGAVLDLLWESFTGPLFYVAMELRTAARTDGELRAELTDAERELRANILAQSRRMFGDEVAARPGFEEALETGLALMTGAAMSAILHREQGRADELIQRFKGLFPRLLHEEMTR
jgi:AcrR family transcriptional regulator